MRMESDIIFAGRLDFYHCASGSIAGGDIGVAGHRHRESLWLSRVGTEIHIKRAVDVSTHTDSVVSCGCEFQRRRNQPVVLDIIVRHKRIGIIGRLIIPVMTGRGAAADYCAPRSMVVGDIRLIRELLDDWIFRRIHFDVVAAVTFYQ